MTVRSEVRLAVPSDVPEVVALVRALADYERALDEVQLTEPLLREALFGVDPPASCHVAVVDGRVVGFALWYRTFSTWTGTPGLWLEDLFVLPEARGAGHGRALLETLAAVAVERGWSRFEWWVLDWNTPAQGFYRSVGARPEDAWTVWRTEGVALTTLSSKSAREGLPGG